MCGLDVGVAAERPEIELVVAVERRLVTQPAPHRMRVDVDLGIERIPVDVGLHNDSVSSVVLCSVVTADGDRTMTCSTPMPGNRSAVAYISPRNAASSLVSMKSACARPRLAHSSSANLSI